MKRSVFEDCGYNAGDCAHAWNDAVLVVKDCVFRHSTYALGIDDGAYVSVSNRHASLSLSPSPLPLPLSLDVCVCVCVCVCLSVCLSVYYRSYITYVFYHIIAYTYYVTSYMHAHIV